MKETTETRGRKPLEHRRRLIIGAVDVLGFTFGELGKAMNLHKSTVHTAYKRAKEASDKLSTGDHLTDA